MIGDCIECAKEFGGCIPTIPTPDTIVKTSDGKVCDYVGKNTLGLVQTPQGFKTELIKKAYQLAKDSSFNDDGEIYKTFIGPLHTYEGDAKNVKLTYPKDFESDAHGGEYRFGTGFDCHRLVEDRKLVLGGVTIPHVKGLLGHSDADVLTHAIMDAILSASSNRDIGYHFSDKDEKFKDISSMVLLEKVIEMLKVKGLKPVHVSAVVMAEQPKLSPYREAITENLAKALGLNKDAVGITFTTLEGIGIVGREEGIASQAFVLTKEI
jgi:2-C-methyl-D-erythritol 2,4-cyclodiphosphate synthase